MWSSYFKFNKCEPTNKLKTLQDEIVSNIEFHGDVTTTNTMLFDEINQWHFHNNAVNGDLIETPTLLVHGYATSSLAYYRNFAGLSSYIKDLYSIDLPTFGLSKTPELPTRKVTKNLKVTLSNSNDKSDDPKKITSFQLSKDDIKHNEKYYNETKKELEINENYYIDRIEKWRIENKLDKINLVGHSFGGYLSYKYATKYPDSIEKLCLVSPLGMESNIYSINNKFENDKIYEIEEEDPSSIFFTNTRTIPKFLFNNQLNVLRWLGPVGSTLTWKYIKASYRRVDDALYKDYIHELIYGKGGMEETTIKTFTNLFTTKLLAKDPITDTVDKLKAKNVLLLYGQEDWMNNYAGYQMTKKLNELKGYNTSKVGELNYATYMEVPEAGHNLFLDNPSFFNKALLSFFLA
ncbi:hypothetical protein TPHA_0A01690 [Tetrapisispora phaffii CBS 4417]|uniref:AB hydrolase-1 domain-containing protein n=1 Tax=Tetrapisispora phaffii (strain ATCC 24235 / CBS 4417 / NBRC 1672 / NRRL Y-8282 / UCD 70-5) TaxID=1071381 RepID=G8BMX4_TETPH|nr:hypothetical protein TPHA_0A01690 [Tetrapisispora phaffii CBS 4417]CCE61252.1 hypothetical protein TPHA_0A01690 [Tetrapisispora phaffii CBS 4417]